MKTIHKAMFFQSEEDIKMRKAFILRWSVDEEKGRAVFGIEPPSTDDDMTIIPVAYPASADEDFGEMVRMMKLMIQPVAVIVDGQRQA